MKLTSLITLVLWVHAICAYNLFKTPTPSMKEQIVPVLHDKIADIDLTAILESTPRNNEVFTQAMISLQNLQGESYCHRLAVQLLMNNCKGIKEISDQGLPFKDDAHKNQVESFITGLTLCVLARGEFVISDTCAPFTASALLRAHQQGKRKLDVSKEQNDACVAALSRDPSQWTTWLSLQREALTICRAVRLDIEKDETIFLHKELTRIMAEFAEGLDLDLQHLQQKMAEQVQAMDSHFASALEKMETKLKGSLEVTLTGFEDVSRSVKSTRGNMDELNHMMKDLLKKIFQSNKEVAAGQEMALVATSDLATTRMSGINAMAEDTSATLNDVKEVLDQLIPAVISLNERQDAMDLKSKLVYAALNNMTFLVNNHAESIEYASFAATELSLHIKEASEAAKSWNASFRIGNWVFDMVFRLAFAATGVVFGGWGLPPSWTRNLIDGGLGFVAYELIKCWILNSSLPSAWKRIWSEWIFKRGSAASPTQHAPENVGSLVITPVNFELTEAT